MNKSTKKPEPYKIKKLHAKVDLKTDRKIRKLAKETGFTISYITAELLQKSFSTGLAKDIFWLYLKDNTDTFLDAETSEDWEDITRLKENISSIQAVITSQEKRLKALEKSQLFMVNGLKQATSSVKLTEYLKEVE